mgnify:CR=1 FL=1
MCIRDSLRVAHRRHHRAGTRQPEAGARPDHRAECHHLGACLLYTSDAADERSSVDLGGRRIIKKKKKRIRDVDEINSKQRQRRATKNELLI